MGSSFKILFYLEFVIFQYLLKIRMRLLFVGFLLFIVSSNGKHLKGHDLNGEKTPTQALNSEVSDRIQELVKEISEEDKELKALQKERDEIEATGNNFIGSSLNMISRAKLEYQLTDLGQELKDTLRDNYDEDALKQMHLKLFRRR